MEQTLLLRGSRDFESREAYGRFLKELVAARNAGRRKRLDEELPRLRRLPDRRRESYKRLSVRVDRGSLIHVDHNTYSVPSRLMGERVEVRLYVEHVEVWYAQQEMERFPRLRGRKKHAINYRHIIDWLVRKPGAFENYRLPGRTVSDEPLSHGLRRLAGSRSRSEVTRSIWGFSTWRHARARRRWTRRCERFWPATGP